MAKAIYYIMSGGMCQPHLALYPPPGPEWGCQTSQCEGTLQAAKTPCPMRLSPCCVRLLPSPSIRAGSHT